ncbi:unnamed protein product [Chilo suppressalis]|uniref:Odorant binding protein n=1 Tax=Chilo suppressalis TaxID=168631 RepID=A0ABN8AWS5_CHISP|nr:unnamed protein product [Chilo suppressalis]
MKVCIEADGEFYEKINFFFTKECIKLPVYKFSFDSGQLFLGDLSNIFKTMNEKNILVICLIMVVSRCTANSIFQVSKCAADDKKCLKKSAQAMIPIIADGIPEFEMQQLDPLVLKEDVDASKPQLSLKVKNMVVTGLKGCIAKKIERDLVNSKMHTQLFCNVRAEGQYEMHGQLLILPIEGEGNAQVQLNKILIDVETDMNDRVGREGKKHWHVKGSRFTFDLKDKAYVKFENLFNGNDVLARVANDIITNNSNDIVTEVGPPIIKAIVDKIIANVNRFFKAMPAEEISLD